MDRLLAVIGDFNAEIGARREDDGVIGNNCMGDRTDRGSLLLHTCSMEELSIANSFFSESFETSWTYRNGERRSQLDYLLLDRRLFSLTRNSFVAADVDIGSDHRPVFAEISVPDDAPRRRRAKRARRATPWQPSSRYPDTLEWRLQEVPWHELNAAQQSALSI